MSVYYYYYYYYYYDQAYIYIGTKFEADSLIRSNVIRGSQNLEIGSRDPGHNHLVDPFAGMVHGWSGTTSFDVLCVKISSGCGRWMNPKKKPSKHF